MKGSRKHIKKLPVIDFSGFTPKPGAIEFVKRSNYFILKDVTIGGDAPKDFIRYYRYGTSHKANTQTWSLYIAKLGHKHYPMESITEYLMNRIGESFGFNMAASGIAWFDNQIRFLSRYFLKIRDDQVLEHGADLYAGYLHDIAFVEEIETRNQSPDFFTVQFTEETIRFFFQADAEALLNDFYRMIVLDALLGNNDRHFYNWGIIRHIRNKENPVFSPIYDTARGLFWNDHEDKVQRIYNDKARLDQCIVRYCEGSTPKIGWEGDSKMNHFKLISKIKAEGRSFDDDLRTKVCTRENLSKALVMIDSEFVDLLSRERLELVKKCLSYRFERVFEIIH